MQTPQSLTSSPLPPAAATPMALALARQIRAAGGWIGFDAFMASALYAPGLGYYARDAHILGRGLGQSFRKGNGGGNGDGAGEGAGGRSGGSHRNGSSNNGSNNNGSSEGAYVDAAGAVDLATQGDFVTAPELGPWFGRALAVQVAQALEVTGTCDVWEFGAGSGALAAQLLEALGDRVATYHIVEVSAGLRARQQDTLRTHGARVVWQDALPSAFEGVVVGNEVLDAMPVTLLHRRDGQWHERGVVVQPDGAFDWSDRPTALQPSLEPEGEGDYLTEIHPQTEAFIRTVAERLQRGAAFFIDYGFPEREYYHPQRAMGTLACHRAHRVDHDPLVDVGAKDITAHVNFTGVALAAQGVGDARREEGAGGGPDVGVLGYTSQARFLLNCGIAEMLQQATWQERALANTLFMEHEMGELFKVIGLYVGEPWDAIGFAQGDRCHTL